MQNECITANIAQTVNVLQAMILTDGEKMVKHQAIMCLICTKSIKMPNASRVMEQQVKRSPTWSRNKQIPSTCRSAISQYLARKQLVLTLETAIQGIKEARYIVGDKMNAHNDFDHPEDVVIQSFEDYTTNNSQLTINIPAMSVLTISLAV